MLYLLLWLTEDPLWPSFYAIFMSSKCPFIIITIINRLMTTKWLALVSYKHTHYCPDELIVHNNNPWGLFFGPWQISSSKYRGKYKIQWARLNSENQYDSKSTKNIRNMNIDRETYSILAKLISTKARDNILLNSLFWIGFEIFCDQSIK